MQCVIAFLAALTILASGSIHRCGLDNLPAGWTPPGSAAFIAKARSKVAARAQVANSSLITEHFILWWTLSGVDAIQPGGRTVLPADSVPGLVRAAATGLESAWRMYVDTLGYLPPVPYATGADSNWNDLPPPGKYPVELVNIGNYRKDSGHYFGVTYSMAGGAASAMLLGADLPAFPGWSYRRDVDGIAQGENYATDWNISMQATAAHELFHAVQYNYETNLGHFLFEASAVAMEKTVIPLESDYLQFADAAQHGFCGVSQLVPMFSAIQSDAYAHAWYVKQLVGDFGEDLLKALWQSRSTESRVPIESTLRTVISGRTGSTLDTTMARYALRLGLSGRRWNWLQSVSPPFAPFSDGALFETLSGILSVGATPQSIPLEAGQIQEWIDTAGFSSDRIVDWIPDAGAQLGHAWKNAPSAGVEWLRGSVRLPASRARQDVWSLSNPGPLAALRGLATTESSQPLLWTSAAPARTQVLSGQTMAWSSGDGAVLSGRPVRDTSCTPLLHTDIWTPAASEDPFAASIAGRTGGHAYVLEDADRVLSLRGASITLPYNGLGTVWIGSGNGVWKPANAIVAGWATVVSLGDLDLSTPLRLLVAPGAAPQGLVIRPYPNPSRGGAPIHFAISGARSGASLEILSADGTAIRRFDVQPGMEEIFWDVKNAGGVPVVPGVYWYVWRGVTGSTRGELLVAR